MNEKAKLNLAAAITAETANIQLQADLIATLRNIVALIDMCGAETTHALDLIREDARAALAKAGV